MPSRRPYAARLAPAERRTQLLDAALAVLSRDGYGKLSIDAIAREAGVTRPVVYGAFDGLEPLLGALLDRQEQRALDQLTEALPLDLALQQPDQFLVATVRKLLDLVAQNPETWRPILLAPEGTPQPVRDRIAADREAIRERFAALLRAGIALRGGPDGVDPDITAHALVGLGEYFGRMVLEDPNRLDTDALVSTVESLLTALR